MHWSVTERFETSGGTVAGGATGDGPPLVLAHGWPWSSFSWHRLIPALADHFRVHWYDMPGYGASAMNPDQATSLDVQGVVFGEMLQNWNLAKPLVVAHDFGGATTLRAHLLHQCDYEKLILMNVVALSPWGSTFFDHVGKHVEAFAGLPPHIHEAIVRACIKGALISELTSDDVEGLIQPWLSASGMTSFYRQFAQADERYTAEIEDHLCQVRCATCVIWGEDDPWIPIERGRRLRNLLPDGPFEALPKVGHMPQLEAPAATARIIASFLRPEIIQ